MLDTRDRMAGTGGGARPPQTVADNLSSESHAIAGTYAAPPEKSVASIASQTSDVSALPQFLDNTRFDANDPAALGDMLRALVERGYDRKPFTPLPGQGRTLERWRTLAAVAACDLGLVKLFEGHTDALAILAELQSLAPPAGSRWGVWAAEPPDARVIASRVDGGASEAEAVGSRTPDSESAGRSQPELRAHESRASESHASESHASESHGPESRASARVPLYLHGTKAWCSGAGVVSHALVTAWLDDEPVLAAVAMDEPSISIDTGKWQAVGMRATASADVTFNKTPATLIGAAHAYVQRPGFWHGGGGIAACWYGAAAQIGAMLRDASARYADAHRLAHLGAVDVALSSAAAVLRETAAFIDHDPHADARAAAMRARLTVEEAATAVMQHATRTLGAGPLCRDARFARLLADLPVFLRQSHAERDLAALGELNVKSRAATDPAAGGAPWKL